MVVILGPNCFYMQDVCGQQEERLNSFKLNNKSMLYFLKNSHKSKNTISMKSLEKSQVLAMF